MRDVKKLVKRLKKKMGLTRSRPGNANVPELFRKTKDLHIGRFLSKLDANTHLIAADELLVYIKSLRSKIKFSSSSSYDGTVNGCANILVLMPGELQCVEKIRADHPDCRVYSVKYDVLPAMVSRERLKALKGREPGPAPTGKFAIFCTPRSGSTYICRLLAQAGYGQPLEHLQEPLLYLLSQGLDFSQFLKGLYQAGSRNGIFGTKFIHHYMFDAFDNEEKLRSFHDLLSGEDFKLIYLERDKVEQAVSQYFAINTNVWHLTTDRNKKETRPTQHLSYDFETIKSHYESLKRGESRLQEFLQRFDRPVLHLDYTALDAEPQETLVRVLEFLDFGETRQEDTQTCLTRKLSAERPEMRSYVSRFREDLGRMPNTKGR